MRLRMELSTTSYAVLALLKRMGGGTPYEIEKTAREVIAAFWPLSRTTVYEESLHLKRRGYVAVEQEWTGRHRRRFSLTDKGATALRLWTQEGAASHPRVRDEAWIKAFARRDPEALRARSIECAKYHASALAGVLRQPESEAAIASAFRSTCSSS